MELAKSGTAAANALEAVLRATPPRSILVDGKAVSIEPLPDGYRCRWEDGSLALALRATQGSVARGLVEDRGHNTALQVIANEERECLFVSFEWALRDAIRESRDGVQLRAANSYITRKKDVEADRDISGYGPVSRDIANRSGLGGAANVELGTYSLTSGKWTPGAEEVLRRLLILAVIKAHFLDRGDGDAFDGEPLFAVPEATDASGKLDAMLAFPGSPPDTLSGIVSWLDHCASKDTTKTELLRWAMAEHDVSKGRIRSIIRTLERIEFIESDGTSVRVTDAGHTFRRAPDGADLCERLIRRYRGLESVLRFLSATASGRVSDALDHLNATLHLGWEATTQPGVRLAWLHACGLLANSNGAFSLTKSGRKFLETLPADLADRPDQVPAANDDDWRDDPAVVAELLEKLFPDETERQNAVALAARVIELIHREGAGRWGVTLHTDRINVNAGRALALGLMRNSQIFLGLVLDDGKSPHDALKLGKLIEPFKILPEATLLEIDAERIPDLLAKFAAEFDRFVVAAAGSASQTPWYSSHSPGVLAHFEEVLGRELPVPEYDIGDDGDDVEIEYWKVSPGGGGNQWDVCRETNSIGVGWNELGDLSGMDRDAFEVRVAAVRETYPDWSDAALDQVWKFSQIPIGSVIVANRGTTEVLGIGRVSGTYRFVEAAALKHTLPVTWLTTTPFPVKRGGWRKTVIELDRETFESIAPPGFRLDSVAVVSTPKPVTITKTQERYEIERLVSETGLPKEKVESWLRIINRKKQVVLQGPPGTGKTWVAKRLARHLVSETDGFADIVQFHPAYSYEDFIQGLRPVAGAAGQIKFTLEPGHFLKFCKRASETDAPCVLIVDEINRANIPRVFGELMYLLEYRTEKVALATGGHLEIPKNVLLIGTMNTADRSIARLDHALRRRFSFLSLNPDYEILRKELKSKDLDADSLVGVLAKLNEAIRDPHYFVGISYFLSPGDLRKSLGTIWECEIEPYLEEYFYDAPDKVNQFRWAQLAKSSLKSFAE